MSEPIKWRVLIPETSIDVLAESEEEAKRLALQEFNDRITYLQIDPIAWEIA